MEFSDKEFSLLSDNRIFGPQILKLPITKCTLPKTTKKHRVMICSFYIYHVYDRHNYLLNFGQKLHLFSDIYFCMDIIMGMVREDILTTYFGNI